MNYEYRLYDDDGGFRISIGDQWYRLAGNTLTVDMTSVISKSSAVVSGMCSIREFGRQKLYAFTHARGSVHILAEGAHAWVTAGIDGTSPKTSGVLEGQTGETAEERLRSYLFRES